MDYVIWSSLFEVGVGRFDRQHRKLVNIINRFKEASAAGEGRAHVFGVLNALVEYAETHFAAEEQAMAEANYPETTRHRLEHERLLRRVFELNEELAAGRREVDEDTFRFLEHWLLDHILGFDRKYGPYLVSGAA